MQHERAKTQEKTVTLVTEKKKIKRTYLSSFRYTNSNQKDSSPLPLYVARESMALTDLIWPCFCSFHWKIFVLRFFFPLQIWDYNWDDVSIKSIWFSQNYFLSLIMWVLMSDNTRNREQWTPTYWFS